MHPREREILTNLLVDLGVAFQKAGQFLAQLGGGDSDHPVKEPKPQEPAPQGTIVDITKLNAKDALALITEAETEDELILLGGAEKGRGSKARTSIMKAAQAKIEKIRAVADGGPATPAEKTPTKTSRKCFTTTEPAKGTTEVETFRKQWAEFTADQQTDYLTGSINSLGEPIGATEVADDGFEDFLDQPSVQTPIITEEAVRGQFQKFAAANGKQKAIAVLTELGVKKIAELDASKYAQAMQMVKC